MDLTQLANLGEFIGGAAVLVTLIYLAVQVRQNTKSIRLSVFHSATTRSAQWADSLASNTECLHTYRIGLGTPEDLRDEDEKMRFGLMMNSLFRQFEDLFLQHHNGTLSDEAWAGWLFSIRKTVEFPGFLIFWSVRRGAFTASFAAFVDREIQSVTSPNTSTLSAFFADDRTIS